MTPRYLTSTQLAGLRKVGDVMIPGDGTFPSFSASGCAEQADRMLAYMTESDRAGVRTLLGLFRFLPGFVLRAIVWATEHHHGAPGPLGAVLRLMNIGIKGAVMTLYYSGIDDGNLIHQRLGWDAKVVDLAGP